jgi:hypothetical protein
MGKKHCYVCGNDAVDVEHIPPTSWFPKGKKAQLITVPACKQHNQELHHDQEYVRAIVVTEQSTNSVARQFSEEKVVRSITRSRRMANDILTGAEHVIGFDGRPTGKLTANLPRFSRVFQMMAYGIYFHLNGNRYLGGFDIYSPNFVSTGQATERDREYMTLVYNLAAKSNFLRVDLANEEVFALGINVRNSFEFVYRLEFFSGFAVLAVSVPPWRKSVERLRVENSPD